MNEMLSITPRGYAELAMKWQRNDGKDTGPEAVWQRLLSERSRSGKAAPCTRSEFDEALRELEAEKP